MKARRLLVCLLAVATAMQPLAPHGGAGAQLPGIDMSKAPADIQAIMKKVMAGGIPTAAEAQRLRDYMTANKDAIAKGASARGDSVKKQAAAFQTSRSAAADATACPSKVALPPDLASAPADAGALLDSIRQASAARVGAASLAKLESALARVTDANGLNQIAGGLLLKGYDDFAILTYVEEVTRAPATGTASAWSDLGAALIGIDEPLAAVPVLRHALAAGPRPALWVTDLGVAYADLGDLTTASTLFQEAIREAPAAGQAYDALARAQSCQGNLILAAGTREKAQDVEWDENRQKAIDRHDKETSKDGSDDDAAEAAKPLPMPPGKSPFPPPPGGGRPSNFGALAPKIPDDYRESAAAVRNHASMIVSYQDLVRQVASTQLGRSSARPPASDATAGMVVVYDISNGHQALAALDVVKRRTAARVAMMRTAFTDKSTTIHASYARRAGPIEGAYFKCDKMKKNCFRIYCTQMKPVVTEYYAQLAGNARTFIGGLAGLAPKFTTTVNAWFFWAGDPAYRKLIDIQRRYYLAEFQVEAFSAAAGTVLSTPDGCEAELAKRAPGAGTLDDAQDPGQCTSRSIKLPKFADMTADCHEMTMTIDFPPIDDALGGGTPTLDVRRATPNKNGKFFLGLNWADDYGLANGSVGFEVTWDNNGWIQGAGPAVTGGLSSSMATANGDLMVNARSQGPTFQGQASGSATVGPMTFAPSVSFGGKY